MILFAAVVVTAMAAPAGAVRVCSYNSLNFPGSTGTARIPYFRTVVQEIEPDILVVQEMLSQAGVNQFLSGAMNYDSPGLYTAGPFVDGPDTDNAIFYKSSVVTLVSHSEISTALRNISEYVMRPVGYTSSEAEFRVYSMHLKAGSTTDDKTRRLAETTILRNYLNDLSGGSCFIVCGDYNIQSSTEDAYEKLVGSESDNDGRSKDPINTPGTWHDNAAFADIHTQSPRTASFGGGATGGMDDRFDIMLVSYSLDDGQGLDYLADTYVAFGNDGQHFNNEINAGTNYAVSADVADAIYYAADHIPVYADFQVPARLDAPTSLAFGHVIVGTQAVLPLAIGNSASAPADELSYALSFGAGFSGPAGPFELPAGDTDYHDIAMDTGSSGSKGASLMVDCDDPDRGAWSVTLTGTVVNHAVPSLESGSVTLSGSVDFGAHQAGEFDEEQVLVWNRGYTSLQALLDVYSAEITGGGGRFGFAGGTVPVDVGAAAAEFSLEFDDAGAATDSLYSATLTFHTRDDQSVMGAGALDDLTVALTAYVESGTSVPEDAPGALTLVVASRNPFAGRAELVLSMPSGGEANVDIFDIRGRLVATLASGSMRSGEHRLHWDGTDRTGGAAASGVYFVRAAVGDWRASRKLVLLR